MDRFDKCTEKKKDFDGLMNLIVREQYLESCPVHFAIFLRKRKPKDFNEIAILAEQYLVHMQCK